MASETSPSNRAHPVDASGAGGACTAPAHTLPPPVINGDNNRVTYNFAGRDLESAVPDPSPPRGGAAPRRGWGSLLRALPVLGALFKGSPDD
ncbi:hypothetical protein [Nocardiopsis flavescens]